MRRFGYAFVIVALLTSSLANAMHFCGSDYDRVAPSSLDGDFAVAGVPALGDSDSGGHEQGCHFCAHSLGSSLPASVYEPVAHISVTRLPPPFEQRAYRSYFSIPPPEPPRFLA